MNNEKTPPPRQKSSNRLGYIIIAVGIFLQMIPFVLIYSGIAMKKDWDMPSIFICFSLAAFICMIFGGRRLRVQIPKNK